MDKHTDIDKNVIHENEIFRDAGFKWMNQNGQIRNSILVDITKCTKLEKKEHFKWNVTAI